MTEKERKKRRRIRLVVILILLLLIVVYIWRVSYPFVVDYSVAMTRAEAMRAVNLAASRIRSLEAFYGDYYEFERNQEGEIVLMRANALQINRLNLMAQNEVQLALDELDDFELELKLGAYAGSALFSEFGPDMHVKVRQVGIAQTEIRSEFYEKGINQSLHRLILGIKTTIDILLPIKSHDVEIVTELIVAEDVIVGRVPDSYITGIGSDDVLNLVP